MKTIKSRLLKMKTMKTTKLLTLFALGGILLSSCSDDDENPDVVNEEETITTIIVTLSGGMNGDVILQSQDLDGDGPNPPVITATSDSLEGNTTYTGSIEFLNETESPAEDITEEVEEEDDEHQVIYSSTGSIGSITTTDVDRDGNPLGLNFELSTNTAGSASLTVTLRHEPTKPNDGTLTGAGGETDATATFNVSII